MNPEERTRFPGKWLSYDVTPFFGEKSGVIIRIIAGKAREKEEKFPFMPGKLFAVQGNRFSILRANVNVCWSFSSGVMMNCFMFAVYGLWHSRRVRQVCPLSAPLLRFDAITYKITSWLGPGIYPSEHPPPYRKNRDPQPGKIHRPIPL